MRHIKLIIILLFFLSLITPIKVRAHFFPTNFNNISQNSNFSYDELIKLFLENNFINIKDNNNITYHFFVSSGDLISMVDIDENLDSKISIDEMQKNYKQISLLFQDQIRLYSKKQPCFCSGVSISKFASSEDFNIYSTTLTFSCKTTNQLGLEILVPPVFKTPSHQKIKVITENSSYSLDFEKNKTFLNIN